MRRSVTVFAPILASAAVLIGTGCHHQEPQRCVDEHNVVVDPSFCANLPAGAAVAGNPGNNGGYYGANRMFFPHYYRNYYGGTGLFGSAVSGGSYVPLTGHSYSSSVGRSASSSGTSRGGFGSSFSSSGGHSSGGAS